MLFRWKDAPSVEEEKKKKTAEACAFAASAFGDRHLLAAFQDELTAVKLDFLLWGWNWVCPAMVREWLREKYQPPRGYRPHPERWRVGFVEMALAGTPIHWARILWKATQQHAGEEKGGSINHLSPFLINFYRSMGCLTAEKRIEFPLLLRAN
ncbi:hypothetical protein AXG93_3001s1020 [Marchantia polymorpha subsp. ruderalis]|uniref:Uncharacterized protein n=1 Tax=Marchantia polymorpha subsp. ruderalis TaxID=1480154 RepID=A0A176VTX7_MARPO|nr:hypothetical protein AXG93_3001s1020 [Marchantia polymorpha subsp. ruderalis]